MQAIYIAARWLDKVFSHIGEALRQAFNFSEFSALSALGWLYIFLLLPIAIFLLSLLVFSIKFLIKAFGGRKKK